MYRRTANPMVVVAIALVGLGSGAARAGIIYVDADAPPGGNGLTWCTAFRNPQAALGIAVAGDEIRVATGTYMPDGGYTPVGGTHVSGNMDGGAAFQLRNGVGLYGGYAGCGAPNPNERNIALYETVLSGDLAGNDGPDFANNGENSNHVVTGIGYINATAVLDGFTITAGHAHGLWLQDHGGGMYTYEYSNPTLVNCTFSGNSGDFGGGMSNIWHSSPTLTDCTFSGNKASVDGGGMYSDGVSPTLVNCTFSGNWAGSYGGGMYNTSSSPTLTNCTFSGNSAFEAGGGMANYPGDPTLTNCTFSGNSATGTYGVGGGMFNWVSWPTLVNCILWGNTASWGAQAFVCGSSYHSPTFTVSYSDVQGGQAGIYVDTGATLNWGPGNIAADPLFVNAAGGNVRLSPGSPCIDAGNNAAVPADTLDLDGDGNTTEPIPFDLDGDPRFVDVPNIPDCPQPGADCGTPPIVDMGAYEVQDCNGNGVPDDEDIAGGTSADANANGVPDECELRFVDDDAPPGGDGLNWNTAFEHLQDALAAAAAYPSVNEIRVAGGTYQPDRDAAHPNGSGDRTATFQLLTGVGLYGGYAGCGAPNPDERDLVAYETILSGNIGNGTDPCDNSYHVVTGSGTDATAILDGFTVTAGNANLLGDLNYYLGGGMFNQNGSPTLTNCIFSGNWAAAPGWTPEYDSGYGGGMYNDSSSPTLTNCTFSGNLACRSGGGMYNWGGSPTLTNCTFSGNWVSAYGGGMYIWGGTLVNCTFSGNSADSGGGMSIWGGTLVNCILWGNTAYTSGPQIYGSATVAYSDIQDGWAGVGNIAADPLFVDADGADDIPGTEDDDLRLLPGSPCIDAGSNGAVPADALDLDGDGNTTEPIPFDLDGNPRFVDDPSTPDCPQPGADCGTPPIVDMGAYEFQGTTPAPPLFVDADAPPGGNGQAWCTAFRNPQAALGMAVSGDEIRVAAGTYMPDGGFTPAGGTHTPGSGDRAATFQLRSGVTLAGGYAGCGAPDPDLRDLDNNASILSGDLAGNDVSWEFPGGPSYLENSYRVVTGSGTNATAILDGFTVTAGNANYQDQGDIYTYDSGGGMFNRNGSPTLTNCTFRGNSAAAPGWTPKYDSGYGGGMFNWGSSPTLTNCTFSGNYAYDSGGGMYNDSSSPTLTNCTFSGNWVWAYGGGMFNWGYSTPTLTNCTFGGNSAEYGGGMFIWGGTLVNCILWGNTAYTSAPQIYGSATVAYSDIQDGWVGVGNIATDPLFVNPAGGDVRLSPGSPCIDSGNNAAVPADTLDLDGDGDTTEPTPFDLDGTPRFVDDPAIPDCRWPGADCGTPPIVDLGAYEHHGGDCNGNGIPDDDDVAGGTSPDCNSNGIPDECDLAGGISRDCNLDGVPDECAPPSPCGDLDRDGDVDHDDYALFVAAFGHAWGNLLYNACCDYDGDGLVSLVDYQAWLVCYRNFIGHPWAGPAPSPKPGPVPVPAPVPAPRAEEALRDNAAGP